MKKSIGYIIGYAVGIILMGCATACMVAFTIKLIAWIIVTL